MKKNIINYFLCLCSALSIGLPIMLFKDINFYKIRSYENINTFLIGFVFIILVVLYKKITHIDTKKFQYVLSNIFSAFMIVGECIASKGSINLIWSNTGTIIITIFKYIGFFYIFVLLFHLIDLFIKKVNNKELKPKFRFMKWYIAKLTAYPFRTSFVSILLVWSLYLIAFYPAIMSPDPSYQLIQYLNIPNKYVDYVIQIDPNVYMTNHHPVFQTYLIGFCYSIGKTLINENFGLFIYTMIQTLSFAGILSYSVKYLKKNGISNKWSFVLLLIYMFVPMYGGYTVSVVKDVFYSGFMMLFVLFLFDYIKNYKIEKMSYDKVTYLFVVMLLMCLFRHNGLYLVVVTFPFVIFYSRKNIIRITMPFIAVIASILALNNVIIPKMGISSGSSREMLSVPFQQTARLVKYHEEVLDENDKKIIDKVLGYNDIANRYNPTLSDPVKNKFNKNTTNDDLKDYFKVWIKGLKKYPVTYIDATLNNTHGYIYPDEHNWYLYSKYYDTIKKKADVDYHYNKMGWLRNILSYYGNIFPYIPVVGYLSNIAVGLWVMLILIGYLFEKNLKKYIILFVPLIGTFGFCILGPANTYFRYAMPYMYVLPVLTILLVKEIKEKSSNEQKNSSIDSML